MKGTRSILFAIIVFSFASCRENTILRDDLWMWGHGSGTTDGLYNIPAKSTIDMADAMACMGVPNVFVVRWEGKPEPPFDGFVKQFDGTGRIAWSITDSAPESYEQKKQWALDLAAQTPNMTGICLDDFFAEPYIHSVDDLRKLRAQMDSMNKNLKLSLVLYSFELEKDIKAHIECVDEVLFWTWHATDLIKLEENFEKYRQLVPDKPTMLGIYMWDFGNSKPIPVDLMKLQLDFALEKYMHGKIEGMIFHCTPLVDPKLDLEAVEYAIQWISKHAGLKR